MAENLHRWAHGAFKPGRLSGTPLPAMRRSALARTGAAGMGAGALALAGLGIFGAAVFAGFLIGRWWRRRAEQV